MKLKSLFQEYVAKWFSKIAQKVTEKINDSKDSPAYLFKEYLKKEESTDLKWSSLTSKGSIVAADVVALDSELPLKKRDSIKKAEGEIPKIGMKLYLNEKQLQDIDILRAKGGKEESIVVKLFGDVKRCISGINERLEYMFLQALSTGVTSIVDEENTGVEIRIDFGISENNKFGTNVLWKNNEAKPINDIERIINEADGKGDTIAYLLIDRTTFNLFKNNAQVKDAFGSFSNNFGDYKKSPNLSEVNEYLSEEFNVQMRIINRSVIVEKNGKRNKVKPWKKGIVTFLTSLEVGTLTYGSLAEENHLVEGVAYQKVDDYVLVSKYHKNDPLREYTSSQANVLPVLDNVDNIYLLDTNKAFEPSEYSKPNNDVSFEI